MAWGKIPSVFIPKPISLGTIGNKGMPAPPPDEESIRIFLAGLAAQDAANQPQQETTYYDDGGGYADGGGGGGYPSLPPYDPATDPSYQALIAQLGLNENQARAAAEVQKQQAARQAATTSPRIQEQGIEQRRNIGLGAEGRGMYRSGQRLRDLSLQQRGESQRLADVQTNLADRQSGIDLGLQGKLQDLANQRVQAGFQAKLAASGA